VSDTTTKGIRVHVVSTFLADRSAPRDNKYLFAYHVTISNTGAETAKLKNCRGRNAACGAIRRPSEATAPPQSRCPRSESPIATRRDGKYSDHRAVTVAATSSRHETSSGYHGLMRASMTTGGA